MSNLKDIQQIQSLIAKGKGMGYLTFDEVNKALPVEMNTPEQFEEIIGIFEQLEIAIVDSEKDGKKISATPTETDDDAMDGSERMPVIDTDVALTSYGFDGGTYNRSGIFNGTSLSGTWGIVAELKDISFMENLTHAIQVGYYRGTNNSGMLVKNGGTVASMTGIGNDLYLTQHDRMWEVNLDTQYQIYKDLTLAFELGYINLDYDENLWGSDTYHENNFKAAMSLNYKF